MARSLDLLGRSIRDVRRMTTAELAAESWDCPAWEQPVALVLDDGTRLYASCDPEGNGPGALFGVDERGEAFAIAPAAPADAP